jgi:hypothetical protein
MYNFGCALLDLLDEALKKIVTDSNYLHADETPLKVLDKNKRELLIADFIGCTTTVFENFVWFDYGHRAIAEYALEQIGCFMP